jgi:hypothetical protein
MAVDSNQQTGASTLAIPLRTSEKLAAECRRLKSMLLQDKRSLPEISSCAYVASFLPDQAIF